MIPYEERNHNEVIDASGNFTYYTVQGTMDGTSSGQEAHYSTWGAYNAFWQFRNANEVGQLPVHYISAQYHPVA